MGTLEGYSGEIIYYLTNLTCILLTLPIFYQLSSFIGNEYEKTSLKMMLWSFIVYVLSDGFFVFYNCNTGIIPIWAMSLNSMINQLSLFLVSYCWFSYGLIKLGIDISKKPRLCGFQIFANLLMSILIIVSPFLGLTYYYTASGKYVRGPLFIVMTAIVFGYCLSIPILAIFKSKAFKSSSLTRTAKSLVYFALVPFFAGLLQIFFPFAPGACLGFVVGLYFVYIDMLGGQIHTDPMTGLNNRRKAELYISDLIQTTTPDHAFYYFALDIDYFKKINDQYGHLEGDHAICIVANAIKKKVGKTNGFAARVGGDEFCIIVSEQNLKEPEQVGILLHENLKEVLKKEHAPYDIDVSVGYTKCDRANVGIEDLSAEADKNMYVNKEEHHENISKNS